MAWPSIQVVGASGIAPSLTPRAGGRSQSTYTRSLRFEGESSAVEGRMSTTISFTFALVLALAALMLTINIKKLKQSALEQSEAAQRSLSEGERKLSACKKSLDESKIHISNTETQMAEEIKKTQAALNEVRAAKEEMEKNKDKDKEIEAVKAQLQQSQEQEKQIRNKLKETEDALTKLTQGA